MLAAQSVLVTACVFAFHFLSASCKPIPAGTPPLSPSRKPSHNSSRSRSRSPEELVYPTTHRPETLSASHAHPSLNFNLDLQGNRLQRLQRSQTFQMPSTFRHSSERSGFVPYHRPGQQRNPTRPPYHRSLSDPHHGLQLPKEDHDPSLDLGLSLDRSPSQSSSSSSPTSSGSDHKRKASENVGGAGLTGDSSKKHRLSHSVSFKDTSSSMPHDIRQTSPSHPSHPGQQGSFRTDSPGSFSHVSVADNPSTPAHQDPIESNAPHLPAARQDHRQGSPNVPNPASGASNADFDRFYELLRQARNVRDQFRARGIQYPPNSRDMAQLLQGHPLPRQQREPGSHGEGSHANSGSDHDGPDYAPMA